MNAVDLIQNFPATFELELADGESDLEAFAYPGGLRGAVVQGVALIIRPHAAAAWIASFSQGCLSKKGISLAASCPDGQSVLVVSKGDGYIVNAQHPDVWAEVPIRPVLGCLESAEHGAIVLWSFDRIVCIGFAGVLWVSPRLSWDGLEKLQIVGNRVIANAWSAPADRYFEISVCLTSGKAVGLEKLLLPPE